MHNFKNIFKYFFAIEGSDGSGEKDSNFRDIFIFIKSI